MSLDLFRKLQKAGIEILASNPATNLFEGRIYYNSTSLALRVYQGSLWKDTIGASSPLAGSGGFGQVPLGGICPIASHLTGSFTLPASGTVSGGWIRCDGSVIPGGQFVSGTTPNLTGSTFITGTDGSGSGSVPNINNSVGSSGGSNSIAATTTTGSTASWNSVSAGTSGGSATFNKNVLNDSAQLSHSHGAGTYKAASTITGQTVAIFFTNGGFSKNYHITGTGAVGTSGDTGDGSVIYNSSESNTIAWVSNTVSTSFTNPVLNKNTLNSDQISHSHSFSLTDARPKYIALVYLMRVS